VTFGNALRSGGIDLRRASRTEINGGASNRHGRAVDRSQIDSIMRFGAATPWHFDGADGRRPQHHLRV